ncbi:DUF1566 domain-containing protein [Variovorax sp. 3P27G3]|uniref:DUF1566 domain-containing protein n=1 Tax=Variovorax sp. 3P27G3 TaxID=2502214 RepID=UPI0010F8FCB2|nr:DUF1566 domain-containing protein [Variovorax sp. 3P27G3]
MPTDTPATPTISFSSLPRVGEQLEGGAFSGVTTRPNGDHVAVVLLPARAVDINWKNAKAWAAEQGGELPSRPVAALLYANLKPQLTPRLHWTGEAYDASYAWYCTFDDGYQYYGHKSYEGCAVAVRLIPLA